MAQRVNVRTSGRGRFYQDASGARYWSVTTLLKGIPKDALMYWTAKEAAVCAAEELVAVRDMIGDPAAPGAMDRLRAVTHYLDRQVGAPNWSQSKRAQMVEKTVGHFKNACWRSSGEKMELGSLIHSVIEALTLDLTLPDISEAAAPYIDQFLAFVEQWKPEFEASELTVYNRTQKYAGTLDSLMRLRGALPSPAPEHSLLLVDYKSGKCPTNSSGQCLGAYPDTALQLAAYGNAEFMELRDGTEIPMPQVDGAAVLHLAPDHYSLVPVRADVEVFNVFLWGREVYRWLQETSKDVVGEPLVAGRAPAAAR